LKVDTTERKDEYYSFLSIIVKVKYMATDLILSKESSESEINAYFNVVLKLSQSDNEFPINLDEVWPLVYSEKSKAVRALKETYIENVDYIPLAQNGERCEDGKFNGSNRIDYKLTVSCMEFFIARKVRPVFEVYRQVFHQSVWKVIENQNKPKREPSLTTKVRVGLEWVKGVSEVLNLNDSSKLSLISKVAAPLGLPTPDYIQSMVSSNPLLNYSKKRVCPSAHRHLIKERFRKVSCVI
jgi:hypothetical protein